MRLADLAERVGGTVSGDPEVDVVRVAPPSEAGPGAVVVVADPVLLPRVDGRASAVIVREDAPATRGPAIRVRDPRLALAYALRALTPAARPAPGVHPTCVLADRVRLGDGVFLGPYVVVGTDAEIGDRTQIHAHGIVEDGVRIGPDAVLHARATIRRGCTLGARVVIQSGAVIGSDGFGYAQDAARHHIPIPQVGTVVLGDDVEVGANSAVDRATLGETRIGRGTKLDNYVHIGHNVEIGEDVAMAAACFIAGSVRIGNRVLMGGMSGVADHLTIGDDAVVLGDTGVTRDVPPRTVVAGRPARPRMEYHRAAAAARRLPDALRELADLRRRLERLEAPDGGIP
ncbi:MAG TPA: UDP-3-O-(3-hydroxymyristoyl)glucosamine N-acyltransferase [bacterium]|nr:UDP-3-O-(3-hydroxymyristoyl)glucosamine N-acyltransferase [bacterium]